MDKGDIAPFAGQLLTPKLSLILGEKAESGDFKLKLEMDKAAALAKIDLDLQKSLRDMESKSYQQQITVLTQRLEESQSRPWYEHPAFIVTITAIGAALVFVGAVYLVKTIQ